jgi:hypothetical protein
LTEKESQSELSMQRISAYGYFEVTEDVFGFNLFRVEQGFQTLLSLLQVVNEELPKPCGPEDLL